MIEYGFLQTSNFLSFFLFLPLGLSYNTAQFILWVEARPLPPPTDQ